MSIVVWIGCVASVFGLASARQLTTADGSSLWIAEIGDGMDCDEMTEKIRGFSASNRRLLESDVFIEEMMGDDDCFVSFSGNKDVAEGVANMKGVVSVSPDNEVGMFWNRDRADQDSLPLDGAKYNPLFDGDGQCLYVIDTGIFPSHNDFSGRAAHGADFVDEDNKDDGNGHGTHCAATAAGVMYGIAPKTSEIYGVKVLSSSGSGSSAGVIKGIQWAVSDANTKKKTCVLSLSLGGGANGALDKAAENAAKNHFVIVAAGNSDTDACNSSPARAEGKVITVGSTQKNDQRSSFSNYGKCVDIFGPGSDILSAYIGGKSKTKVLSGTSMATPYIAGLALQALQKNGGNYENAFNDLFSTATSGKIKDPGANSPNLLGRTFDYTGPPTPPTLKPTAPPTVPDPTLCKWNDKSKKYNICSDFAPSTFGNKNWVDTPVVAPVVYSKADMCQVSTVDYTGKIVMVDRGGCLFFEKVKNAENQGAVAVFIIQSKSTKIFEPAYYGQQTTNIPSCMVPYRTGTRTFKDGDVVMWGSLVGGENGPSFPQPTTVPSKQPTSRPTKKAATLRPTKSPTVTLRCDDTQDKMACNTRTECNWDGFVCYIKHKYQNN